jgi:3-methyladenine DNA glycosylase AlkD
MKQMKPMMSSSEIISQIKRNGNPRNVEGMARFGINPDHTYGVSIPFLRDLAKKIGKSHALAQELWKTGIHEARILASFIDEPDKLDEKQLEDWVRDFDSWDICDQVCSNLFDKTQYAWKKAHEWPKWEEEFVRRAGFVLMAALSVHDKKAKDDDFLKFFPSIRKYSTDERNFVKKAVNWALRQIGKRNPALNKKAIALGEEILKIDSKTARWIAADALRELRSEAVRKKLATKKY